MSTPKIDQVSTRAPGENSKPLSPSARNVKYIGLLVGVLGAILVYFIFPQDISENLANKLIEKDPDADPATFGPAIAATAAIAVLMGLWWMFEAIPLAATALVPLVAFPLFEVAGMGDVGSSYGSPTIFLFMGGFFLALTMQRWNLHLRIALVTVLMVGTSPRRLVLGFMVATGLLSMWVSNTATAVMMLPIGISVLALVKTNDSEGEFKMGNFGIALMLGIAYAASIASLSTLIGTPPNTILRGYLQDSHDITLNFGTWMLFATPLAWLFLIIGWWVIVKLFPPEVEELPGGRKVIEDRLKEMGPMSAQEKVTGIIFIAVAVAWIARPFLWNETPLTDEVIAMILALVLFMTPAKPKDGIFLLNWGSAKEIPWDVLLLFGGGLALSSMFGKSGLSLWIGEQAAGLSGLPIIVIVAAIAAIVIFLTEMTSNTATAAAFLPIIGGVAIGMGVDVELLVIPTALAATCAFMLPVATPPNAIAYGSGYLKIQHMVRTGLFLNLIGIVLITIFTMYVGPAVLGYSIG